jgi:hypothetical protein
MNAATALSGTISRDYDLSIGLNRCAVCSIIQVSTEIRRNLAIAIKCGIEVTSH